MQYREDPKTGNRLSALGYGCMRFPGSLGRVDLPATEKLVLAAIEGGVNYFDTAYLYPGSEEALGTILHKNGLRDKVFIATKLPQQQCKSTADFDKFFAIQKQRLRTDFIDNYFMHNISAYSHWDDLKRNGIEAWIAAKKERGEIRQVGFSFHGSQSDFEPLLDDYDWDFVQIQYNYMNENYQAGRKGLRAAASRGLPVFVMEPLLGGKLATGLPKDALEGFRKADRDRSPVAWALGWLWDQPEVTLLLSGMNTEAQLRENLALADAARPGMLSDADRATIADVVKRLNRSYKVPCTGCNYCMPCPQGINIPTCFSAYNASYAIGWTTGMQQYLTSTSVMSDQPHTADVCVQCGKCEKHCPQKIAIRAELKKVKRRFQPPGFRTLLGVARRVMR